MDAGLYSLPGYSFFSMTRKEPKESSPPGAPRSSSIRRRSFLNEPGMMSVTQKTSRVASARQERRWRETMSLFSACRDRCIIFRRRPELLVDLSCPE